MQLSLVAIDIICIHFLFVPLLCVCFLALPDSRKGWVQRSESSFRELLEKMKCYGKISTVLYRGNALLCNLWACCTRCGFGVGCGGWTRKRYLCSKDWWSIVVGIYLHTQPLTGSKKASPSLRIGEFFCLENNKYSWGGVGIWEY